MIKVVAECGVNFTSVRDAIDMIRAAKKADAYAVKFQLFNEETIKDSPLFEQLRKLVLTEENVKDLQAEAKSERLAFVLTPMYLEAVDIANKYADAIKIRFKDNENKPLIDKVLDTGKPVLISVPKPPMNILLAYNTRVFPLYCIPKYPPEPEDFNLDQACVCKGFSSHFPHTLFDLGFAYNHVHPEVYLEKHVMFSERMWHSYLPDEIVVGQHTGIYTPDPELMAAILHPIDEKVSITFEELATFIKQVHLIERIQRTRV
jgi:sialic acid synthase SpsE